MFCSASGAHQQPHICVPPKQLHEQKDPSPGVHPNPGNPSGLPAQSSWPLGQHGVSWPPLKEFLHAGAWLAFGPHATTPASSQTPFLQMFSTCHELLHGPPHWLPLTEHAVPLARGFVQSGSEGPAPPEEDGAPPVAGDVLPLAAPDPPVAGSAPPLSLPPPPALAPPSPVAEPPPPPWSPGSPLVTPPQARSSAAVNTAARVGNLTLRPMHDRVTKKNGVATQDPIGGPNSGITAARALIGAFQ